MKINNTKSDLKQRWLDLINQYPNFSRTDLRKKDPSLYMRIYRHDKEWLKKHPTFVKTNVVTNKRVDWVKRDLQMLAKVKKAVEDLNTREKPVKITISSIGKSINQLSLLEKNR